MILAHKIRLYPNNEQVTYLKKACGVSRFAYNWALGKAIGHYQETKEHLGGYKLIGLFNSIKKEQYPWVGEVTTFASQRAILDVESAFCYFFKGLSKYPKFKKKGKCKESFYFHGVPMRIKGKKIHIPRLGWVRMAQEVRFPGKPIAAVASQKAGNWFVSIHIELDDSYVYPHICENQAVVGVDLGIKNLATLSTGEKIPAIRALARYERKLKRLQSGMDKKQKSSKNREKAKKKVAKLHHKISNLRNDVLHKTTSDLAASYKYIGVEDLNVSGMLKNHKLAKAIFDVGLFEFRRQLTYKSKLAGSTVVTVDRFFPSSKTCSACGEVKRDLKLKNRVWSCTSCGVEHDRDINAALNLGKVAAGYADTINACGEESTGSVPVGRVKLAFVKQEGGICNVV